MGRLALGLAKGLPFRRSASIGISPEASGLAVGEMTGGVTDSIKTYALLASNAIILSKQQQVGIIFNFTV